MENRFILTPYFLDEPLPRLEAISGPGWRLNRPTLPDADPQIRMSVLHESLADRVEEAIRSGDRPVSIAGDCCAAIGVVAGLQRAAVDHALIWFDAHGDFNTWETSPSGFLGGMPLAMLVGRGDQTMPRAIGLRSLAEDRVLLTDARDLDPGEKAALGESRIARIESVSGLLEHPVPDVPVHVHIDVDIIDPAVAPAMNFPAPGGPGATELEGVFRFLARTREIAAISVSTWNPDLDEDGRTGEVCMDLLHALYSP